jgi:hypothetical protein
MLAAGDWRNHGLGKVLEPAISSGEAAVWLSATHVLETMLTTDHALRARLASLMLELSGATRMNAGFDFVLVNQFGEFLNQWIPDAFDPAPYLESRRETAVRVWLGYLGLLAAVPDLELGPGLLELRRAKLESHAIHARFALAPVETLERIVDCSTSFDVTTNPDPLGLSKLTDEELQGEVDAAVAGAVKPPKDFRKKMQAHRDLIVAAYGASDIGGAIASVFTDFSPWSFILTFRMPVIIQGWQALQHQFGCAPLPVEITNLPPRDQARPEVIAVVMERGMRAAAKAGLAVCTVSYDALLRDIEQSLNQGTLPTPGAALDADHAVELTRVDIYVCRDRKLRENLKTFAKKVGLAVEVVETPKQLERALA